MFYFNKLLIRHTYLRNVIILSLCPSFHPCFQFASFYFVVTLFLV